MIDWTADEYVICTYDVCFTVLTTLIEFETVSETKEQMKPIVAPLINAFNLSSLKVTLGKYTSR